MALVDRSARRLELTATGRDYHARAITILAALDELDGRFGTDDRPDRKVTVAVDARLGPRLLVPALTSFQSANPGVVVELVTRSTDAVADVTIGVGGVECELACKFDPVRGVIGVQL